MSVAIGSLDGLLDGIAGAYGLGAVEPIERALGWGGAARWRLRDRSGRELCLKERAGYLDDDEHGVHLALHEHVARQGAPVARLHRTAAGALALWAGGRLFELREWIEGAPRWPRGVDDARRIGVAHGEVSAAARSFTAPAFETWESPRARTRWFPDRGELVVAQLDRIARAGGDPEDVEALRAIVRAASRIAAEVAAPVQWIHGDASVWNVCWRDDGSPCVIDLDDARWGFRLWDLATLATSVGAIRRPDQDGPAVLLPAWDWERVAMVVDGFDSASPLAQAERRLLPAFLALAMAALAVSEFDLDEDAPPVPDRAFARRVRDRVEEALWR